MTDSTFNPTDLFEKYADAAVEDMDIEALQAHVKESICDRLEDLTLLDAIGEIQESAYADDLGDDLERATDFAQS